MLKARKPKTREQIQQKIADLRKDLFFSFGVPDGSNGPHPSDPRVHVEVDKIQEWAWVNDVDTALGTFEGAFAQTRNEPKPRRPSPNATRRPSNAHTPRRS